MYFLFSITPPKETHCKLAHGDDYDIGLSPNGFVLSLLILLKPILFNSNKRNTHTQVGKICLHKVSAYPYEGPFKRKGAFPLKRGNKNCPPNKNHSMNVVPGTATLNTRGMEGRFPLQVPLTAPFDSFLWLLKVRDLQVFSFYLVSI